jgi:hypothetical protein
MNAFHGGVNMKRSGLHAYGTITITLIPPTLEIFVTGLK